MNIAFDISCAPNWLLSGIPRYIVGLVSGLSENAKTNFLRTFYVGSGSGHLTDNVNRLKQAAPRLRTPIPVRGFGRCPLLSRIVYRELFKRTDILHLPFQKSPIETDFLAAIFGKSKKIVTMHDLAPMICAQWYDSGW